VPRKVFVAGEILTAADVNTNLMDQAVMVFDDAAARTTAIPSPVEGMVTYLKDTDTLEKYTTDWVDAAPGKILQVVSTTKTDTFSSTTSGFQNITGLSVSITPTATTSKVLLLATVNWSHSTTADAHVLLKFVGGNTATNLGDTASNRTSAVTGARFSNALGPLTGTWSFESSMNYLDSPNTVSAVTYDVQANLSAGTIYINRSSEDADTAANGRFVSSITAMEVAG
jgi:hypothetical protein